MNKFKPKQKIKCKYCKKLFQPTCGSNKWCCEKCRNKDNLMFNNCKNCGKKFGRLKNKNKFCCHACYTYYFKKNKILHVKLYKNIKVKCINCNKIFETLENRPKKFCSLECFKHGRRKKWIHCKCIICKKKFQINPLNGKNTKKFCSRECQAKGQIVERVKWQCPECGEIRYLIPSEAGHRKFCSYGCSLRNTFKNINNRKKWIWKGVYFLSKGECICASIILTKPIIGYNCHVPCGNGTIDFFPQKGDKMFIGKIVEYHIVAPFFHENETARSYRIYKRKQLNANGFRDRKLIILNKNFIKGYEYGKRNITNTN